MKKPVFAANWKMNLGPQETRAYLKTFLEAFPATEDRTVMIFPPAISLVVAGFEVAVEDGDDGDGRRATDEEVVEQVGQGEGGHGDLTPL